MAQYGALLPINKWTKGCCRAKHGGIIWIWIRVSKAHRGARDTDIEQSEEEKKKVSGEVYI